MTRLEAHAPSVTLDHATEAQRIVDVFRARDERPSPTKLFGYDGLFHFVRIAERQRETLRLLRGAGLDPLTDVRILDLGCGTGHMLRALAEWGAMPHNLTGVELRQDAVDQARRLQPQVDIRCVSSPRLPFGDNAFDLVCVQTVFTSILNAAVRSTVASEIDRVLRRNGCVLWYNFRYDNPRNANVAGIRRAEIDALFPGYDISLSSITLAPPVARRIPEPLLPTMYSLLSAIPLLRTHYLGLFRKTQ